MNDIDSLDENYIYDICSQKDEQNWTWNDIANKLNLDLGLNKSSDFYRKKFYQYKKLNEVEDYVSDYSAKVTLSDILTQTNANIRRLSREDTCKQIGEQAAQIISKSLPLFIEISPNRPPIDDSKIGVLQISDWHYGIEIDNVYNYYNPEITKCRVELLLNKVLDIVNEQKLSKIIVANLGDLIAGRIHLPIRINSRVDVITQTIRVSELLAEFLSQLSKFVEIDYYSVIDNHSRIDPNKKESLQTESLARITQWYLKERFKNNCRVIINDNEFSDDIMLFDVFDHRFAGIHGDLDKFNNAVSQISMLTQEHFDVILSSHLHHLSINEDNRTLLISNPSLMGTDELAMKLRKNSYPAQNLIISTEDDPVYSIYRLTI